MAIDNGAREGKDEDDAEDGTEPVKWRRESWWLPFASEKGEIKM